MTQNDKTPPMQTLSSHEISTDRFSIVEDKILVHGQVRPYSYVKITSGVCILPFYQGKIALTREYRYPISSYQWQLPGGCIDPGESPIVAGIRELHEETGLVAEPEDMVDFIFSKLRTDKIAKKPHKHRLLCAFKHRPIW